MIIDIQDWDITYIELHSWCQENNVSITPVSGLGKVAVLSTKYRFHSDFDFVAFKLKFSKSKISNRAGYNGTQSDDMGTYYAPYIPSHDSD